MPGYGVLPPEDFLTVIDTAREEEDLVRAAAGTHGTNVAAVLGSPIDHSLSPLLHRTAYNELGLSDWQFQRYAVGGPGEPTLAHHLSTVHASHGRWRGMAITMPLKEDALAAADLVCARAADLRAANTLIPYGRGWAADNTDIVGIEMALQEVGIQHAEYALIIGSGATARAALAALVSFGVEHVTFAVRSQVRPATVDLAKRLEVNIDTLALTDTVSLQRCVNEAEVTISTLPTGTDLSLPPLSDDPIPGIVMDVVYANWPTALGTWAQAAGARVISGLPMLLHQAAAQVRAFTGRTPNVAHMRQVLEHAVTL
ncbi:shikimate dehydrogenase [Dermatophilus congolensis]|uniref:shikimate dehydrogenase n=1 Tax=Dermatophilus congolensis TaxID=1863 RepID=UPI001AAECFDF|nr:shikimate dehydrogenase [Dermatophilus congolensis]MBO3132371.1 shikimate dehydrogenase [Dermatophilus congolensis]MBO3133468.1 shikimate dehydrogenase [Dermatophilus congolensis]MBO3135702.1 shikimate dehydrogenase [Dermatophilus congolensis]MBO3137941.1 shikimate dehydrogenase [Dermatophilus congolensis]